jgi:hypothetical protein
MTKHWCTTHDSIQISHLPKEYAMKNIDMKETTTYIVTYVYNGYISARFMWFSIVK